MIHDIALFGSSAAIGLLFCGVLYQLQELSK